MLEPEAYRAWAPPDGRWSRWVKPVLFAYLHLEPYQVEPAKGDRIREWRDAAGRMALVLDHPGERSLEMGLALVPSGFRPIPLYNTSPGPKALLDVAPILRRLKGGCGYLEGAGLPPDAPPAFLLDVDRLRGKSLGGPGSYDNRWAVVPQDFPSANFLLAHGIDRVALICAHEAENDLAHVLLRWQRAGIAILRASDLDSAPTPTDIREPSGFRAMMHRFSVFMGLRRNSAGGFGAVIPEETTSGGGFG